MGYFVTWHNPWTHDNLISVACLDLSVCILSLLPLPEVEVGEDALLAVDDGREEHDLHDHARGLQGCNSIGI